MTDLERAILHIKTRADAWAVKEIEKALSQEPTEKPITVDEMEREYEKSKALFHKIVECDDAISRQAVLDGIAEWIVDGYADSEADCSHISSLVTHLPSVTQKSGKCKTCKYWQDNNNGYPSDMCKWRTDETPDVDDFCSEFEPQESEDKE